MPCYHPLEAWRIPDGVTFSLNKALEYGPPVLVKLPCKQCIGCRLDYSRQWADRCMLEMQSHEESWFLTLTYDDDHLPKTYQARLETGEVIAPVATLVPRDLQLFFKRLRFNSGQKIRYFACGEYGSQTMRPHYHAIVFGLSIPDKVPYAKSALGYQYYNSALLDATWRQGYVVVGEATWDTCAYTARYILKKQTGKEAAAHYQVLGIEPEFVRMSRRPGIGREYYDTHPDLFRFDAINISTPSGGRKIRPPEYYRRLFSVVNEDRAKSDAKKRQLLAIRNFNAKKRLTDLDDYSILRVEEQKRLTVTKALKREL